MDDSDYDETIRRINAPTVNLFDRVQRTTRLVILDIVLSIGLALVGWWGHEASNQAQRAAHATEMAGLANCQANNGFRTNNSNLWAYLVANHLLVNPTPAELAELRVLTGKAFAQRNCAVLNGSP